MYIQYIYIYIYIICNIHIIYVGQRGLAKSGLTMAHPTILYDASLFLLLSFGSSCAAEHLTKLLLLGWKTLGLVMSCGSLFPLRRCCTVTVYVHVLGFQGHGTCHCEAEASPHHWLEHCRMAEQLAVWLHSVWFRPRCAGIWICFLSCVSWVCFWPCVQAFWHLLTCEHWYMIVQQVGCNHAEMYWVWLRWLLS